MLLCLIKLHSKARLPPGTHCYIALSHLVSSSPVTTVTYDPLTHSRPDSERVTREMATQNERRRKIKRIPETCRSQTTLTPSDEWNRYFRVTLYIPSSIPRLRSTKLSSLSIVPKRDRGKSFEEEAFLVYFMFLVYGLVSVTVPLCMYIALFV